MPPTMRPRTRAAAAREVPLRDKWIKLSRGSSSYGGFQLRSGLNVDPLAFNRRPCVAGGLHACRLAHAFLWINTLKASTIWDVEFPGGDKSVVDLGNKAKSPALTLSNCRPIEECPDLKAMMMENLEADATNIRYWPSVFVTAAVAELVATRAPQKLLYIPEHLLTKAVCKLAVKHAHDILDVFCSIPYVHRTTAMYTQLLVQHPDMIGSVPIAARTFERCVAAVRMNPDCYVSVPSSMGVAVLAGVNKAQLEPVPEPQSLRRSARVSGRAHRM